MERIFSFPKLIKIKVMAPLVGEKRVALFLVLFCFCLLVSTLGVAFASSENWVEVTRFTGIDTSEMNAITTEPFTCYNVEWRIRWSYQAHNRLIFGINIIENESKDTVSSIVKLVSTESESGISYFTMWVCRY